MIQHPFFFSIALAFFSGLYATVANGPLSFSSFFSVFFHFPLWAFLFVFATFWLARFIQEKQFYRLQRTFYHHPTTPARPDGSFYPLARVATSIVAPGLNEARDITSASPRSPRHVF